MDGMQDREQWLEDRKRFRVAAEAVLDPEMLWPAGVDINPNMAAVFYERYRRHSEAAFALLKQTMAVWEVDAGIGLGQQHFLPVDIEADRDTFHKMYRALEKNELYMKLLRRATEIVLEYMQEEREVMVRWYEENLLEKA